MLLPQITEPELSMDTIATLSYPEPCESVKPREVDLAVKAVAAHAVLGRLEWLRESTRAELFWAHERQPDDLLQAMMRARQQSEERFQFVIAREAETRLLREVRQILATVERLLEREDNRALFDAIAGKEGHSSTFENT